MTSYGGAGLHCQADSKSCVFVLLRGFRSSGSQISPYRRVSIRTSMTALAWESLRDADFTVLMVLATEGWRLLLVAWNWFFFEIGTYLRTYFLHARRRRTRRANGSTGALPLTMPGGFQCCVCESTRSSVKSSGFDPVG